MPEKPTLQLLPGEILQIIHSFLPLGSKVTLSLTCKRFYNSFFEKIPPSYLNDPIRRREFETIARSHAIIDELKVYDFLRSRELCGFKSSARNLFCCDPCHSRHLPLFFHPADLNLPVSERACIRRIRGFWVEPGKCFSFADLDGGSAHRLRLIQTPRSIPLSEDVVSSRRYTLWTHYDILTLPMHKRASKEQIARILSGFDLPTCPHMRLSDSVIMDHCDIPRNTVDEPLSQRYPPFFDPVDLRTKCTFPSCLTSFCWTEHASADNPGWKTIYLHILRRVRFNSSIDHVWMAQLVVPNETLMERHWDECFRWKTEMLAIEKEMYENEESISNSNGTEAESSHETYLARKTLLRRREEIVNALFHPRRLHNYPHILRRLQHASEPTSATGNSNNPDMPCPLNRRPWTPPTKPIVTNDKILDIDLSRKAIPRESNGTAFKPFMTGEDFQLYGKRANPVSASRRGEQNKPNSWLGRLFKLVG
ncbi:hypothetical protein GX51_06109 [Blastomyces parvus]|uniref:F-box domain-containing protein n=1 Tax=Blastomyces parvus TaxID=2060905 RepID=A0A2B7WTN6_9EURO|nr:hypothetical protein GX51_06109 [Blastomyces parvus]